MYTCLVWQGYLSGGLTPSIRYSCKTYVLVVGRQRKNLIDLPDACAGGWRTTKKSVIGKGVDSAAVLLLLFLFRKRHESMISLYGCEAGLTPQKQQELKDSEKAHLFVRKVVTENGMVLPFTYVGQGNLTNPRSTENVKGSLLFDIRMDAQLPDYLQYDFGLSKGNLLS